MKIQRTRNLAFCLLALIVLSACGDKSGQKSATQVAARVNDSEISVHQINFAMQQAKIAPEQAKRAAPQVLERLIDQELVVQKALQQKLDRDPQVMQQLEATRREVLQRAYAERLVGEVETPNDLKLKDYYAKHPELFSERRVYTYRVIVIQGDSSQLESAKQFIGRSKNLDDLAASLKAAGIKHSADGATRAAEQIPLQLLPGLHKLKDGQMATVQRPGGIEVIHLLQSRTEPVGEERARSVIQQFIMNQEKTETVQKFLKDLRAKSKLEYMGDFKAPGDSAQSGENSSGSAAQAPKSVPSAVDVEKALGAGLGK